MVAFFSEDPVLDAFSRQYLRMRVLCVQLDARCIDFGFHRISKTESRYR
jgi:hypothetical protein